MKRQLTGDLERRLAQQTALADFACTALRSVSVEALVAEADRALRAVPGGDTLFTGSVAEILDAATSGLRAAEASRHAALHDPLTGLANRSLILDHLALALARAGRRPAPAAVIFLDVDDFKGVNDARGHVAGDELLVQIAERLGHTIRPSDTLGRWGGDEFVAVCENLEHASDAPAIVGRIASCFDRPFAVQGRSLQVGASIGVAVSEGRGDDPEALIHSADEAMYRIKRSRPLQDRAG